MKRLRTVFDWLLLIAGPIVMVIALGWLIGSDASRTPVQNTIVVFALIITPIALCVWLTGDDDE